MPTNNEWGVPVLRLDRQVVRLEAPFTRWGRDARKNQMRGTWHFYTDDYRFSRLWERPTDLPSNTRCAGAVECNFSVSDHMPPAVALWQIYRKRYLARVWQDLDVCTIVDLNVPPAFRELNLLGVPRGWRAYCTRGSSDRIGDLSDELALAVEHAQTTDVLFCVYGGGRAVQRFCLERGLIWLREAADAERGRNGSD